MRILWLCNIVLPEFRDLFGFKQAHTGGWISGMWDELKQTDQIELGICLPIKNPIYMKNGIHCGRRYYSFSYSEAENDIDKQVSEFTQILTEYKPDIIHIWGTEYLHSFSMIRACEKMGLISKVVVDLQGMISYCARYVTIDIPDKWLNIETKDGKSINQLRRYFEECGRFEEMTIKKAKYVVGRTSWDRLVSKQINDQLVYYNCPRILQEEFYNYDRRWSVAGCIKWTIFMSQGSYPIKGIHYMIKALAIVKKKFYDVGLKIAGMSPLEMKDGGFIQPYGYYLSELIREYDLTENIEFLGPLDATGMIKEYLSSNVVVSASTIENNCNSLCEAMFLGAPVISSFVGGMPDIITHRKDGLLYPLNDIDTLAGYICDIFEDNTLSEKISYNAINTAHRRHDKSNITRNMQRIYQYVNSD